MKLNWKVRVKNKGFWLALIPAALLLVQAVGQVFGLTLELGYLGDQLLGVVNALFAVLAILGVVNDPTTQGLSDSGQAMTYDSPKGKGGVTVAVKGVDLSEMNGAVDFQALKNAGARFVILRCGYGSDFTHQDDKRFGGERGEGPGRRAALGVLSLLLRRRPGHGPKRGRPHPAAAGWPEASLRRVVRRGGPLPGGGGPWWGSARPTAALWKRPGCMWGSTLCSPGSTGS